ncbi:MAG TPA: hypothetical protein VIU64_21950, partial [Polyangia bacterium]
RSVEASAAATAGATAGAVSARDDLFGSSWPFAPRAEISWRYLPMFRPGAQQSGQATGKVADETFSTLTARVFPTSSLFRFGLGVDFGWESGHFATSGDYFVSETTSLGLQWRGRFTPFLELLGGGGYLRRIQSGVSLPSALWFFGVEGGLDIYTVDRLYVHVAVGRMRLVNALAQISGFSRLYEDAWTFRLGIGL